MSYYDPYYSTPRSRRPSLTYVGTPASIHGVPLAASYHEPLVHTYSQPAYTTYTPTSYDDLAIHDPYYPERRRSVCGYPPLVQPLAIPRPRRSSTISYAPSPVYIDHLRSGFGRIVKFKRKGAFQAGITIGEANANVRLSGSDTYTFQDLGVDARGKIYVNLRLPGYPPLNYEIPVDGYSGYVDIQSLARRVGRAVSHYLQANVIPIRWDRIEMQHLEEMAIGTWHLKMSTQ